MKQRLSILVALLVLPLAAAASETKTVQSEAASPPAEAQAKKPAQCAMVTGTRIRPSLARACDAPKPSRSYSAEDLERTGQANLGEALRRLDPIFR